MPQEYVVQHPGTEEIILRISQPDNISGPNRNLLIARALDFGVFIFGIRGEEVEKKDLKWLPAEDSITDPAEAPPDKWSGRKLYHHDHG